jgi:hypothetical protein
MIGLVYSYDIYQNTSHYGQQHVISNPWDIISGGLLPSHAFASRYILLIVILFWGSEFISYIGRLIASLWWRRSPQWLSGHQLAARINSGGCVWFRIKELGASAKVILVMDSSIWVLLDVLFPGRVISVVPWPQTRNATDCLGGSWSKVSVLRITGPSGNRDGKYEHLLCLSHFHASRPPTTLSNHHSQFLLIYL